MIEAHSLCKTYPGEAKPALNNLDLRIEAGEFLSILGRSGSGKTTLLHTLSSLVLPDSGQILFEGRDICAAPESVRNRLRREDFAIIFQQHHLLPYLSALENILLPFLGAEIKITEKQKTKAYHVLGQVGLGHKAHSRPGELSGGEQQRVAIARAVIQGARILFADEPTGSLDSDTGASILQLLQDLNRAGMTIVMVTHNPEFATKAGRFITMSDGRVTSCSPA